MNRVNPLHHIYESCNAGNSKAKHANLPEFPRIIDVELVNLCNFRCLMCPTGNHSMKREQGFLSAETYYKLLDEIRGHNVALRFIRWGEPLMHPKVIEFFAAAKKDGHLVHLNTNGSLLTPELADKMLGAAVDSIKFSFQGVCRDTYNEMRNIDFFDGLLDTIAMMHAKRGQGAGPFIQISTTVTYESQALQDSFLARVKPICDAVNIGSTSFDWLDLNAVRLRPHEIDLLKRLKELESVDKVHPECPEVFDKMSLNWDGKVTACCMDSDDLMVVGDIKTEPLLDIWHSEKLEHYRRMLAEMRHDDLPLCQHCWDTHSLSATGKNGTAPE
jgi:radical SAM protein with 4Fe4S-binding SPASM domain